MKFTEWETNNQLAFLDGYSEVNQTIKFQLTEDSNVTAHFDYIDYKCLNYLPCIKC